MGKGKFKKSIETITFTRSQTQVQFSRISLQNQNHKKMYVLQFQLKRFCCAVLSRSNNVYSFAVRNAHMKSH